VNTKIGNSNLPAKIILSNIILKYTFNSEGKIVKDSNTAYVDVGMIWKVDFSADTKHEFEMSFRVNQLD